MPTRRGTESRDEAVAAYIRGHPPPVVIRAAAIRMAKRCREALAHPDGAAARDAEETLYGIIKSELEALERGRHG